MINDSCFYIICPQLRIDIHFFISSDGYCSRVEKPLKKFSGTCFFEDLYQTLQNSAIEGFPAHTKVQNKYVKRYFKFIYISTCTIDIQTISNTSSDTDIDKDFKYK